MTDLKQKILAAVKDDLVAIEQALADNLEPCFDLVEKVAGHLLFAGGKRLRPLLMVLCARLCGRADLDIIRYSTIFEYLHAATLLHDDIVDGADMRRGRQVAHRIWDPSTVVLAGDFLLARGLSVAADTGSSDVIRTIAQITENMSQGEIRQLEKKGDLTLTEAQYHEVIRCKTAVLFQGACRTGALVARSSPETAGALDDYGYHLGLAFQMADDLLDYTQNLATTGKVAGADLREGKMTLPLIYTMSRASDADRRQLMDVIGNPDLGPDDFTGIVALLEQYGGIAYTRDQATDHIRSAKTIVQTLEDCPEREILLDIAEYALVRKA